MKLSDILNLPTPLQLVDDNFKDKRIQLYIKRDDLIHPWINGNKYRKLRLNLDDYYKRQKSGIISFGGAFSNHLVALGFICHYLNIPFVAIVRSYSLDMNNPILKMLVRWGAQLVASHPNEYKLKEKSEQIQEIIKRNENYLVIPEGGTNELAVEGSKSIWREICSQSTFANEFFTLCTAGTGGTFTGIANQMKDINQLIVTSPFKNDTTDLEGFKWLNKGRNEKQIINVSNGKRFGQFDEEIVEYINFFYHKYKILLDPLYTAKTMYWLDNSIENDQFKEGSKLVFIHTGGLCGIIGYNYLHGAKHEIKIPREFTYLFNAEITNG